MKKILVVDDDSASCELLREIFAEQGWQAETAQTPERARELAREHEFDLVISDVNLEAEESGLDLLKSLRERCPVILLTGFGSLEAAVEATREGAWDLISKPFKVEEVVETARRAMERVSRTVEEGEQQQQQPGPEILSARYEETGLLGRSPAMIELYKEIARVAPTRSTVLVMGESGTGKELVARAVHKHSPRSSRPFVAVNCGALTETLLEAELFGHVRGAFTGAVADRRGLWEEAEGGTLFLDEVGETSPAMQVKLLRALQEGEIRRVGASRSAYVDARVVAATNRDLEREVRAGTFREDLFYRLGVVSLRVPPLKERRSDIPLLAERFLRRASVGDGGGRARSFSRRALETLAAYDWPGNVRELESAVEYAAIRARGAEVATEDLPAKLQAGGARRHNSESPLVALHGDLVSLDELERRYLIYVLEKVGGNRTRAAEILGIDRRTFYRMAERFRIKLEG